MTAKEQANELVNKYSELLSIHIFNGVFDIAKECALIAVNEIILEMPMIIGEFNIKRLYWQQVKQEIENL
jgi:hypothetical protein